MQWFCFCKLKLDIAVGTNFISRDLCFYGGGDFICLAATESRRARRPNHSNLHPVRLAYQPPAGSTFLSEQISTSHQPPGER
jgi:hypothetical protein